MLAQKTSSSSTVAILIPYDTVLVQVLVLVHTSPNHKSHPDPKVGVTPVSTLHVLEYNTVRTRIISRTLELSLLGRSNVIFPFIRLGEQVFFLCFSPLFRRRTSRTTWHTVQLFEFLRQCIGGKRVRRSESVSPSVNFA